MNNHPWFRNRPMQPWVVASNAPERHAFDWDDPLNPAPPPPPPPQRMGYFWNPFMIPNWIARNTAIRTRAQISAARRLQSFARNNNRKTKRFNKVKKAAYLGYFEYINKYKKPYRKPKRVIVNPYARDKNAIKRRTLYREAAFVDPFDSTNKLN